MLREESTMSKQANIYVRFSPRPDADDSKSNEKQEERCRDYCARKGYEVVGVFPDRDISGKKLDRPGLNAALAALRSGSVLVVDHSDRLARDMLVCLTIRYKVQKAGAEIEYADGSPTHTTPEGELFQNILASFAQYERARFARRTKAGLAKKKANGEWLGRPPIGWQIDKVAKKLVRNEHEQLAITQIRSLASGGVPTEEIALHLTEQFGLCRGKPWSGRTIRKILARKS